MSTNPNSADVPHPDRSGGGLGVPKVAVAIIAAAPFVILICSGVLSLLQAPIDRSYPAAVPAKSTVKTERELARERLYPPFPAGHKRYAQASEIPWAKFRNPSIEWNEIEQRELNSSLARIIETLGEADPISVMIRATGTADAPVQKILPFDHEFAIGDGRYVEAPDALWMVESNTIIVSKRSMYQTILSAKLYREFVRASQMPKERTLKAGEASQLQIEALERQAAFLRKLGGTFKDDPQAADRNVEIAVLLDEVIEMKSRLENERATKFGIGLPDLPTVPGATIQTPKR